MQNKPLPPTSRDDDPWDAFLADEDQLDPQPEPGDFWIDVDTADCDIAWESEGH